MRVIPVIDLMGGHVVRGVAGERSRYRPVVSQLAQDAAPHSIAQAFAQRLGAREVYVADLDAIAGHEPDWDAYGQIAAAGLRLLVDAGIGDDRRARQMAAWASAGSSRAGLVVGLESVRDPGQLSAIYSVVSAHACLFSLDLRSGEPLTEPAVWQAFDPRSAARLATDLTDRDRQTATARQIADVAVRIGFRRLLVLDLAAVGVNRGPATAPLCRELRDTHPDIELIAGGGVRGWEDLQLLARCGCHAALVASALHDGRLSAAEIQELSQIQLGLPSGQSGPNGPSSEQCSGRPRGGAPRLSSTSRS